MAGIVTVLMAAGAPAHGVGGTVDLCADAASDAGALVAAPCGATVSTERGVTVSADVTITFQRHTSGTCTVTWDATVTAINPGIFEYTWEVGRDGGPSRGGISDPMKGVTRNESQSGVSLNAGEWIHVFAYISNDRSSLDRASASAAFTC